MPHEVLRAVTKQKCTISGLLASDLLDQLVSQTSRSSQVVSSLFCGTRGRGQRSPEHCAPRLRRCEPQRVQRLTGRGSRLCSLFASPYFLIFLEYFNVVCVFTKTSGEGLSTDCRSASSRRPPTLVSLFFGKGGDSGPEESGPRSPVTVLFKCGSESLAGL